MIARTFEYLPSPPYFVGSICLNELAIVDGETKFGSEYIKYLCDNSNMRVNKEKKGEGESKTVDK